MKTLRQFDLATETVEVYALFSVAAADNKIGWLQRSCGRKAAESEFGGKAIPRPALWWMRARGLFAVVLAARNRGRGCRVAERGRGGEGVCG